jgi:hypothetical protein
MSLLVDAVITARTYDEWALRPSQAAPMFTVTEAEATAIRAAFDQGGEFAAAVELRRLFPAITYNAEARECARTGAAWRPLTVAATKLSLRR